jgi:hypothetical protein
MSSHIADPVTPFHSGFRETNAVFSGGKFLNFLTTFTILNNLMTGASIKLTPILVHKKTLNTFLNACTNHGYHALSFWILKNNNRFLCSKFITLSSFEYYFLAISYNFYAI